ncbi:hypothetical protein [[Clostridium] colinum]|uniref:hypothetical protein n=1 Tax=[Clostridium] colinum TaxID=36835 RepID=UPI00202503FF|nr:hypothetical protein [[Clostridium] colinum]
MVEFSDKIIDTSYVLFNTHIESRFNNFVIAREYVKQRLNDDNLNLQDIKDLKSFLIYSIEELGQVYKSDSDPIKK